MPNGPRRTKDTTRSEFTSNYDQRGIGKGVLVESCPESTFKFVTNLKVNFAHPSSDGRNEIPAILHKFGAQFATLL